MIEIVPHWKIGPKLLCGRDVVHSFEEFFFFKLRPVSSAQGQFLMWFLHFPPKKVQRCKFFWRLTLQNLSYDNFIRYGKLKMADFWKETLKLPEFQKRISQESFRVRWKNFAIFCFLLVGKFQQNLKRLVTKLKTCRHSPLKVHSVNNVVKIIIKGNLCLFDIFLVSFKNKFWWIFVKVCDMIWIGDYVNDMYMT